jgi:hypothetical protein
MPTARPDVYAIASGASLYAGGGAPAPAPAPSPAPGAYRNAQPLLFQAADVASRPSSLGGQAWVPDLDEQSGPSPKYVSVATGWPWNNNGGDWTDANLVSQGPTPWAQQPMNGTGAAPYTFNVLALAQHVQTTGRWMALRLAASGAGARQIAGRTAGVRNVITYGYSDGSSTTHDASCVANAGQSTFLPQTTADSFPLPAFLEFPRPDAAKTLTSASLVVRVTAHFSGTADGLVQLLTPPINAEPDTATGLGLAAQGGALDTALPAGVLVAHRFQDGAPESDFLLREPTANVFSESNYNPVIWGGAPNSAKWPNTVAGKFLVPAGADGRPQNISISSSAQLQASGVTPLAPGFGALTTTIPAGGVPVGGAIDNNGSFGCDAFLMLPEAAFGVQTETFWRYYVWIEGPQDPLPAERREYLRVGVPVWEGMGGKFGIVPHHSNSYGGQRGNGGGGGGFGYLVRQLWRNSTPGAPGPDRDGWVFGQHLQDDWNNANNPPGHRYGYPGDSGQMSTSDERAGRIGGLGGTLYAGRWYLVEGQMRTNTAASNGTWQPDGILRLWLDGRLVWAKTDMVFRTLPAHNPAYDPSKLRPARELGITGFRLNFFAGGQEPSSRALRVHHAFFAHGTARIGALKTSSASLPSWVPAYSDTVANVEVLTTANGRLTNNVSDVNPPNYFLYYQRVVFYAYSGGAFNPHWGSFGAYVYSGAGHSAGNENTAYNLAIGEQCTWSRLNDPTPFYGTGTDPTTQYNNSVGVFSGPPYIDPATCASPIDGQVAGTHTWGSLMVLPPRAGSEKGRVFMPWAMVASYYPPSGICSFTSHSISITSESTPSASRKWQAEYTSPTLPSGLGWNSLVGLPGLAVYDEPSKRVMLIHRRNSPVMWYDDTPGFVGDRFVSGTGTRLDLVDSNSGGGPPAHAVAVPERRLAVMVYRKAGQSYLSAQTLDMSLAQPAWNNTPANFTAQIPVDADWSCVAWSSLAQRLVIGDVQGDRAKLWLVEIPAILSNPWVCTPVTMSQPCTRWRAPGARSADNVTDFGKWAENPHTRCFIFFNKYPSATEHVDEVFAIRLPGI